MHAFHENPSRIHTELMLTYVSVDMECIIVNMITFTVHNTVITFTEFNKTLHVHLKWFAGSDVAKQTSQGIII